MTRDANMLPELTTERLALRELQMADGPALQAFANRPEQWKYQAIEPEEFANSTLRIQRYMEHRGPDEQRRIFAYSAYERKTGQLIGQVSLSRSHPKLASLGFSVSFRRANNGFATEMACRLIVHGFHEIGLHRIEANVAVENKPCLRVLQKIGMTHEGTLRDCIWVQGRWWTEAMYSILENECAPID